MPENIVLPAPEQTGLSRLVLVPEPCPQAATARVESCRDTVVIDVAETDLLSLGRIVQVDALIKNVCPGKRVAVALLLAEEINGVEAPRGMKTLVIPPQEGTDCRDVELRCVPFVVPEEGNSASLCGARVFKVRVLANYMDTDYACCDPQTVIP